MTTMMMTTEPFVTAEAEYRRQRAAEQFGPLFRRRAGGRWGARAGNPHRVRRRPSLRLPHLRRRPLYVA